MGRDGTARGSISSHSRARDIVAPGMMGPRDPSCSRHPGLRIATQGVPVYGRAPLAGYGSGFKVVRDLRIAVDIGGTFTDVVLEEGGRRLTRKLLTTPQRPEEAVLDGVRL